MTLIGFLRGTTMNVYAGEQRVITEPAAAGEAALAAGAPAAGAPAGRDHAAAP
jgi:hypothetical protein